MNHSLRVSEKLFNRALWIVALIFAYFLCGLGASIVGDLPKVTQQYTRDDFIDKQTTSDLRQKIDTTKKAIQLAHDNAESAQLKSQSAQADYDSARETFENWLKTRQATANASQDNELISRTAKLDSLRGIARKAQAAGEEQEKLALQASNARTQAETRLQELEAQADKKLDQVYRRQELHVFFYRLALTLPLLIIGAYLFIKHRKSKYWPFVWGYIFFALFSFFVELVPYLPSYGGYIRYSVGMILTLIIGRYAIIALNNYREKQKQVENLPEPQRKKDLSYDLALARLVKNICPGCERPYDTRDERQNFCPHCGIQVFEKCTHCQIRKSAFTKFCFGCGHASQKDASQKADRPTHDCVTVNG